MEGNKEIKSVLKCEICSYVVITYYVIKNHIVQIEFIKLVAAMSNGSKFD